MLDLTSLGSTLHLKFKGAGEDERNPLISTNSRPEASVPIEYRNMRFGIGGAGNIRK